MKIESYQNNNLETLTPEQIEELKKQYGEVYSFELEGKKCFIRKPDRRAISAAMMASKKDSLKFNEVIMKNCWLAGDKCFVEDDDYYFSISESLDEIIEFKKAELVKH